MQDGVYAAVEVKWNALGEDGSSSDTRSTRATVERGVERCIQPHVGWSETAACMG